MKAEIKLTGTDMYEIKPVGFFSTSISVTKNGEEIANLQMNWRGQIVLAFHDGRDFVLKGKGTFHNRYIIEGRDEQMLVQFHPKFNWKKFDYSYEIMCATKPQDILLVLLGVYACNYLIAAMSGAM
jgi:hypothetical protein